jgi:hypothetical protein
VDLPVPATLFRHHHPRRTDAAGHVGHPLLALAVRPDQDGARHLALQPSRDGRRGGHHARRNPVDLFEAAPAVQVRVHRDQEIDGGRQQARIAARRDRLARAKALVLAHVGKVGRHQPDLLRAEFAGRIGREHQRHGLVVRALKVCDEQHPQPGDGGAQSHDDLAIGKMVRLHRARGAMELLRHGFGQGFSARRRQHKGFHASSLTWTVSDCMDA